MEINTRGFALCLILISLTSAKASAYVLEEDEYYSVGTPSVVYNTDYIDSQTWGQYQYRHREFEYSCSKLAPTSDEFLYPAPGYEILSLAYTGYEAIPGSTRSASSACWSYWDASVRHISTGTIHDLEVEIYGSGLIRTCPYNRVINPRRGICATKNDINKDCGDCGSSKPKVGNPIDPSTGIKYVREIDYHSPSTGLSVIRTYNSGLSGDESFGNRWSSNITKHLEVDGDTFVYRDSEGRGELWTFDQVSGSWSGDPDTKISVSKDGQDYLITTSRGDIERYGYAGELISDTAASGKTTSYVYDNNSRLVQVIGPFGHTLDITYTSYKRIGAITNSNGEKITYNYQLVLGNNFLKRATFADQKKKEYTYKKFGSSRFLDRVYDEKGVVYAKYKYDSNKRAISTEHATTTNGAPQQKYMVSYDSETPITRTITDAAGNTEEFEYQSILGVSKLTRRENGVDNQIESRSYDGNGNLISSINGEGHQTVYSYNAHNQRISKIEAFGTAESRETIYSYYSNDIDIVTNESVASVATGLQKQTTTTYDAALNPISVTHSGFAVDGTSVSRAFAYSYNTQGQVTQIDGPLPGAGDTETFTYHECATGGACGQLASVTNALGHTTTYDAYDAAGQLLSTTDPNGVVTTFIYDARNRLTSRVETPPAGQGAVRTTTYTYDPTGKPATISLPGGQTVTHTYDAAHNLVSTVDNLGNRISYDYDIKGNQILVETRDPDGTLARAVARIYNHRNYVTSVDVAGSTHTFVVDTLGNVISTTDPNNNIPDTSLFNARNQLTQTTDSIGSATQYQYDIRGNVISVLSPNTANTLYEYDDLGNLTKETSPDRGMTLYTYDAAGRQISITDARGIQRTMTYDALNRLETITYPTSAENVSYQYDTCQNGLGRLCSRTDESGTTTYSYDAYGNITQESYSALGSTWTTTYTYDEAHRITSMGLPSGRTVSYTYDAADRVQKVDTVVNGVSETVVDAIQYRSDRRITGKTWGNGLTESRQYDAQGRLLSQDIGTILNAAYSYDANGNILSKTSQVSANFYTYDSLDRLETDTLDGTTSLFTYDPNHNRLSQTTTGSPTQIYTYSPASNQLDAIDGTTRAYTQAGHLTDDGNGTLYAYNDMGRLTHITDAATQTTLSSQTYNAAGQRKYKTANGEPTVFHYGLEGELIGETTLQNQDSTDYIWMDSTPIGQVVHAGQGEALQFIHVDHLDTPRLVTNNVGTKIWSWNSDGFGSTPPDNDPDGDGTLTEVNLRFPGQYYDSESGLYYNWNRYYDPEMGRYTASDPIGLDGGINTYSYSGNNPTRFIDPYGLAYFALRPLDGMHNTPTCTRTIGNIFNLKIAHEQVFFEDGRSPSNLGFFNDGLVRPDRPKFLSQYSCKRGGYNDCIMRIAVSRVPGGSYCLTFLQGKQNNCQDWADRVRAEYEIVKNSSAAAVCKDCDGNYKP